ncbi:MAG: TrbC/VirB2 family type IV secretion system protein [Acidiferrobacteraceae bacterium]
MKRIDRNKRFASILAGILLSVRAGAVFAATNGGLPWDGPVQTLQNDLTGPIATGISVVAFLAAGAALVFGEELGGIAKKALFVVMGVAMIVLGNGFLSALGLSGAII